MAFFKSQDHLVQTQDPLFDATHGSGATAPMTGIYRCVACGAETVAERNSPLPAKTHHVHSPSSMRYSWQLVAMARESPKARPSGTEEKERWEFPDPPDADWRR
jgi:hypothetical protein